MSETPAGSAGPLSSRLSAPLPDPARPVPFGRLLVAMVTPFTPDREVDCDGAQRLADHLVGQGCDGLVVSGTTGESPTTSDAEKERLLTAVVEAVGDRVHVVAGTGTNDTAHSIELSRSAEKAGADGLLLVTPYYSKPPQAALLAHFRAVADGTGLPVMLYDIPGRTGTPIATETLLRLAEHDQIVAVKDAKEDIGAASQVIAATDLAFYSGSDMFNLPLLSVGAVGFVSVVGHLVARDLAELAAAWQAGDARRATAIHQRLVGVYVAMTRTQLVLTTKAALAALGLPAGPVRPPLLELSGEETETLRRELAVAGLSL